MAMRPTFTKAQRISLGVLATLFFLSVSIVAVADLARPDGIAPHFDWPDETSNAYFASRFAETGKFAVAVGEDLDSGLRHLLVPRSFNFLDGSLVPAGFLGLPLYYGIAERAFASFPGLSGTDVVLFATPFLAALALLAFAHLVARAFGPKAGTYAAFALALSPAWWYYSAYPFLPNVPAVAMAIFALALLFEAADREGQKATLFALASGACLGAAAAIRPNDVAWYALAAAVAAIVARTWRGHERTIGTAIVAAAVAFAPVLLYQHLTYGSFFATGYSRFADGATLAPSEFSGSASTPLSIAAAALALPYGIHPRAIWYNLWRSWLALAPWFSLPALAALAWLAARRRGRPAERFFLVLAAVASAWLVVSYGSWMIADPLVLKLNTIGVSHVRYWLLLDAFGAAAIGAAAARYVGEGKSARRARSVAVLAAFAVFGLLSARMAFVSELESLIPVAGRVASYGEAALAVVRATPPQAVIVTDRTDKEIFPDRAVTAGFPTDDASRADLRRLACDRPLYLYAGWSDSDLAAAAAGLAPAASGTLFSAVSEPRPGYRLWKMDDAALCPTAGS